MIVNLCHNVIIMALILILSYGSFIISAADISVVLSGCYF